MLVGKGRSDLFLRAEHRRFYGQDGHIATFPTSHCRDATQPVSGATVARAFLGSILQRRLRDSPEVPPMVAVGNH